MAKSRPKKPRTGQEHLKIKGDPKAAEGRHHGKRPTPERPPAPRVPPKRRER
ncbi:MAG: hypothetical protein HOP15_01915 [Planctomycetes bacterium]|nr:hypothetical protein [Planctomycetota bacterium]